MRVGLFGGSFNPPHAAHQLVALYVLETQALDELWFVPTYTHPFNKALVSYEHRVAMCELAAAALGPRVRVSRAEHELAQAPGFVASRTLDLVNHVIAQGHAPRLVIGADILGETAKWYRWDAVAAAAPPIVVGRAGHALPAGATETGVASGRTPASSEPEWARGSIEMPYVSSTRVRELFAAWRGGDAGAEQQLAALLPRQVMGYIARERLYL